MSQPKIDMAPPYRAYLKSNPAEFLSEHRNYDRGTPRRTGRTQRQITEAAKLAREGYNVILITSAPLIKHLLSRIIHCPWLSGLDPSYDPTRFTITLSTGVRIMVKALTEGSVDQIRGTRRSVLLFEHHLLLNGILPTWQQELVTVSCIMNRRALEGRKEET
jgi:hypothetical protein